MNTDQLKSRRILLAEDIPINAQIMKQILQKAGMDVDLAENGKQALELFAGSRACYYDAILMDVQMPVMDGLEAARQIRSLPREDAGSVPILAMTGEASEEDVARSMEAGMNSHLTKPVKPDSLYRALAELMTGAAGE